ncbi:Dyp-type peroxidase [Idiomarina xiamenensis]|uniref:Dyp-type peroxidase n=1 Tax=Idiomarina xiamenensis 10-D-4 TaxID=740709 RepID=K2KBU8_9GAMM|nr:Dyp-type peroxidase [Idiomarina xiamenensis]EKE85298.1 Dyp-type peroxidase [Idiomarina xiamenensis 10-D-4]
MQQPQTGVCAEPNLHGLTLFLNVMTDDTEMMRRKLAQVPAILRELDERFSEAMLNGFVAVGNDYWDIVYNKYRPLQLQPFPDLQDGDRYAPRQPVDLLLSVRSDRFDANYLAVRALMEWFGHDVELVEQIRTFRYLDGRDLNGFIEAPDNPRAMRKRAAALIDDEQDSRFAAGSYLFLQKFRHDLRRWELLPSEQQEQLMGRRKVSGERLPEAEIQQITHAAKARLFDAQEQPLLFLRQNMPWGDLREQGLLACYFSQRPRQVTEWLKQRYYADVEGDYDPWLDYTQALSNAAFFVPSIDFLENSI